MDEATSNVVPLMNKLKHPVSGETCWYPGGFNQTHFNSAMNFKAKKDDVFVCSYVKSGTTWLQHIVWLITHYGEGYFQGKSQRRCIPMLEFDGDKTLDGLDTKGYQRIIKTHFEHKWVPYHSDALYLYIAREPKDVLVSYYYHIKGFHEYNALEFEISTLYDMFMNGEIEFNDHCDHVAEWYKHRNDPNVLFLLYEDLQDNLEREVIKIAKFLGRDYLERAQANNGQLLKDIVEKASFSSMAKQSNKEWVGNL